MTTKEILELYKIKMVNLMVSDRNGHSRKTFLGGNEMESYFDMVLTNPSIIEGEIIPIVQHFIDGNNPPIDSNVAELGGLDNYAIPFTDGVRFYNPNNGEIIQTVPLEHFKKIALAWKDFLMQ